MLRIGAQIVQRARLASLTGLSHPGHPGNRSRSAISAAPAERPSSSSRLYGYNRISSGSTVRWAAAPTQLRLSAWGPICSTSHSRSS